jgi:hypothetical protein
MKMFSDGDALFAPMLNALFAAMQGTAVTSGCIPSCTGTNRTVSIAAGEVRVGGTAVSVPAGSVSVDAGGAFDRYDLVAVNGSGSLTVTKGTEAQKCPAQPANTCLLAIVSVPAGATVIGTGGVLDARLVGLRLADVDVSTDKDWGGKTISNASVSANAFSCLTSTIGGLFSISPSGTVLKTVRQTNEYMWVDGAATYKEICRQTIPAQYRSGTVRLLANVKSGNSNYTTYARWLRNGSVAASTSGWGDLYWPVDVLYSPGDVLVLEAYVASSIQFSVPLVQVQGTETILQAGNIPWA